MNAFSKVVVLILLGVRCVAAQSPKGTATLTVSGASSQKLDPSCAAMSSNARHFGSGSWPSSFSSGWSRVRAQGFDNGRGTGAVGRQACSGPRIETVNAHTDNATCVAPASRQPFCAVCTSGAGNGALSSGSYPAFAGWRFVYVHAPRSKRCYLRRFGELSASHADHLSGARGLRIIFLRCFIRRSS
jgi:hypothetical protein